MTDILHNLLISLRSRVMDIMLDVFTSVKWLMLNSHIISFERSMPEICFDPTSLFIDRYPNLGLCFSYVVRFA